MRKRVIILGSDPTLLETRRQVLETHGIPADIRLVGSVMLKNVVGDETEVLVACSSLSPEARQAVVELAHSNVPSLKCLVVESGPYPTTPASTADAIFEAFDGPEKFISRVQQLVAG